MKIVERFIILIIFMIQGVRQIRTTNALFGFKGDSIEYFDGNPQNGRNRSRDDQGKSGLLCQKNVEMAQEVLKKDEEEDVLKAKATNEMIGMISNHPERTKQLINLILIAKNLEKIGDHADNIAEDVIFMVLGQDVRHHTAVK